MYLHRACTAWLVWTDFFSEWMNSKSVGHNYKLQACMHMHIYLILNLKNVHMYGHLQIARYVKIDKMATNHPPTLPLHLAPPPPPPRAT